MPAEAREYPRVVAGRHVWVHPLQSVHHRKGRGVEYDRLPAALAVRQEQAAPLNRARAAGSEVDASRHMHKPDTLARWDAITVHSHDAC
jgi:hypothetical protein